MTSRGGYSDFLKCLVPGTCCKYGPDLCLKIMKNRLKRRKMTLLVLLVPGFEQKRPKYPGISPPNYVKIYIPGEGGGSDTFFTSCFILIELVALNSELFTKLENSKYFLRYS